MPLALTCTTTNYRAIAIGNNVGTMSVALICVCTHLRFKRRGDVSVWSKYINPNKEQVSCQADGLIHSFNDVDLNNV